MAGYHHQAMLSSPVVTCGILKFLIKKLSQTLISKETRMIRLDENACVSAIKIIALLTGATVGVWTFWDFLCATTKYLEDTMLISKAESLLWNLMAIAGTILCTILGIAIIPAMTILLESLRAVRHHRDDLLVLLGQCRGLLDDLLGSKTDEKWGRALYSLYELDHAMSGINRSLRPYIEEKTFHSIEFMRALISRLWGPLSDTIPAKDSEQWKRIRPHAASIKRMCSKIEESLELADKNNQFARLIKSEIYDNYYSIWFLFASSMRNYFRQKTSNRPGR
jgi:hypothetical protein